MVFKEIQKKPWRLGRKRIGENQISITKYAICIGPELGKTFLDRSYVRFFIDEDNKKVVLVPTADRDEGYKIRILGKDFKRYNMRSDYIKMVPIGLYEGHLEEGCICFSYGGNENEQKQL